jgi:arginyl-tRNA synthetase
LKKAKKTKTKFKINELTREETELVKKLSEFPDEVSSAGEKYNPSVIAHYAYELAQKFNEFYHACPVIDSREQDFRIALVHSFKIVLKNALNLLGIETLEEM